MLHIKDGVTTGGITPALLDGLLTIAPVFHRFGVVLVVTALTDGAHKPGSLHYRGYAADIRSRDIPQGQSPALLEALKQTLGMAWDVLLETDHVHLEFDPHHDGGKTLP